MISAYYGLVIAFAISKSKKETSPYVLVQYQEMEIGIDIATNKVMFGSIPFPKQILAQAWIEIHKEELIASWQTGKLTGEYFRLEPLR